MTYEGLTAGDYCPKGHLVHEGGYCGVCAADAYADALLKAGCPVCGRTNLMPEDMFAGWLSDVFDWAEENGMRPVKVIACKSCLTAYMEGDAVINFRALQLAAGAVPGNL